MHFWKLLASIAVRYQLLKHDIDRETEKSVPSESLVVRTELKEKPFSGSSVVKHWLETNPELKTYTLCNGTTSVRLCHSQARNGSANNTSNYKHLPLLHDIHNITNSNRTTEINIFNVIQQTNKTDRNLVQELPRDFHHFRINDTWNDLHSDALPKLTWLALTTGILSSVPHPSCTRWNCPCSGYSKRQTRSAEDVDVQLLRITTETARQQTKLLLEQLERERFRDNLNHISALRRCSQHRVRDCLLLYVEDECALEGLPQMHDMETHAINLEFDSFLQQSRMILANIAMFTDKMRTDEKQHYSGYTKSLEQELLLLDELGIYHLLCAMDKGLKVSPLRELPAQFECDANLSRSKADNRNYIVLHTLESLLHSLVNRLQQTSQ